MFFKRIFVGVNFVKEKDIAKLEALASIGLFSLPKLQPKSGAGERARRTTGAHPSVQAIQGKKQMGGIQQVPEIAPI
jgi:hypothetical protein